MLRLKNPRVDISIPRKSLEAIFDECDKFAVDETGGRIIGTYQKKGRLYDIDVLGIIDAGPNAQRSPTSFFQDGEYQEKVFRSVEEQYPDVEHLGNWHTHHVNGLSTLSSGDQVTYRRIVNHEKHNTDFFYALLVVRKTPSRDQRYEIKHYLVFRNDDTVYEIPASQVHVVEQPVSRRIILEGVRGLSLASSEMRVPADTNPERAKDLEFFSEGYPGLKPGLSKNLGAFYWRGKIGLVDGSHVDVVAIENSDDGEQSYSVTITTSKMAGSQILEGYRRRKFKSARYAVLHLERAANREIYLRNKE